VDEEERETSLKKREKQRDKKTAWEVPRARYTSGEKIFPE